MKIAYIFFLFFISCSKREQVPAPVRPQYKKELNAPEATPTPVTPKDQNDSSVQSVPSETSKSTLPKESLDLPEMRGAEIPKNVINKTLPLRKPGDPHDNPEMGGLTKEGAAPEQKPVIMPDGNEYKGLGDR